jgi:hypothetical protein
MQRLLALDALDGELDAVRLLALAVLLKGHALVAALVVGQLQLHDTAVPDGRVPREM